VIDLEEFGRALSRFRLAAGFQTREQAADATGLERAQVHRHEAGKGGRPQPKTLDKYERAYGLAPGSLAALLDGRQPVTNDVPRGTIRHPITLPRNVRLRENEIERELIDAGATDEQVRDFRQSVRDSPLIAALFRGGAPDRVVSDAELQLYEGVAIGFKAIVEQMLLESREARRR
jgi:transcriptional regulator with XRE-family HTH domain